jgi:hypothetical protein
MKKFKNLIFASVFSLTVIIIGLFNHNKGLIKPSPNLSAYQVLNIQLQSLKNNKKLRNNLGIIQTYEFAHPENKKLTGPIQNFTRMIQSDNYSILLNHEKTKVGVIHQDQFHEVYLIQVTKGKKSENFLWTLITYIDENKNAFWYTVNVIPYSKVST